MKFVAILVSFASFVASQGTVPENGSCDGNGTSLKTCAESLTCQNASDALCGATATSGCTCKKEIQAGENCGAGGGSNKPLPCKAGSTCLTKADNNACSDGSETADCVCLAEIQAGENCGAGGGSNKPLPCKAGSTCLTKADNNACSDGSETADCVCLAAGQTTDQKTTTTTTPISSARVATATPPAGQTTDQKTTTTTTAISSARVATATPPVVILLATATYHLM